MKLNLSISNKIILMGILAAILPAAILLYTINGAKNMLKNEVEKKLMQNACDNLESQTQEILKMLESQQEILLQMVTSNLRVIEDIVSRKGSPKLLADTVSWQAVNQLTKTATPVTLPKMALGNDEWLGQNFDPEKKTPVVDDAIAIAGGAYTIFQKMNA